MGFRRRKQERKREKKLESEAKRILDLNIITKLVIYS